MTNSIQNLQSLPVPLATNGADATRKTSSQSTTAAVSSSSGTAAQKADQASLSTMSGLVAQASAGPDVRLDRVASLRQSIAAGTYNVSASDVAGKIVDSLLS